MNRLIWLCSIVVTIFASIACTHRSSTDQKTQNAPDTTNNLNETAVQFIVKNEVDFSTEGQILIEKAASDNTQKLFCPNVTITTAPTAKMILGAVGYYRCSDSGLDYPCVGHQTPTGNANVLNIAEQYCRSNVNKPYFADTLQLLPRDRLKHESPCDLLKYSELAPWFEVAGIRGFLDRFNEHPYSSIRGRPDRLLDKQRLAKLIVAARLVRLGVPGATGDDKKCTSIKAPGECMSITDAAAVVAAAHNAAPNIFADAMSAEPEYRDWVGAMGAYKMGDGARDSSGQTIWGNTVILEKSGIAKLALRAMGVVRPTEVFDYPGGWFPDAHTTRYDDWRWYVDYYGAHGFAHGTNSCPDPAVKIDDVTLAGMPFDADFDVIIDRNKVPRNVHILTRVERLVYCQDAWNSSDPYHRRIITNQFRWQLNDEDILDIEFFNAVGLPLDEENSTVWRSFSAQTRTGARDAIDVRMNTLPITTSVVTAIDSSIWDKPLREDVHFFAPWVIWDGETCPGEMRTRFRFAQ